MRDQPPMPVSAGGAATFFFRFFPTPRGANALFGARFPPLPFFVPRTRTTLLRSEGSDFAASRMIEICSSIAARSAPFYRCEREWRACVEKYRR